MASAFDCEERRKNGVCWQRCLWCWQATTTDNCFWSLEVIGQGGSGKSVKAESFTMLAGKGNTVSASMAALKNLRERALRVGGLIILLDMARYAGDGAGIGAITGGEWVTIDPKHKAPYSIRIPAVVLVKNNNAMMFSDRGWGISHRRVIFF